MEQELNEIVEVCQKFAGKEIAPHALEADLSTGSAWVKSIWTKSQAIGIPGLLIPEEFNGAGQSELCCALVLDALAFECAGAASVFAHHFAGCIPMMAAQKQVEKHLLTIANIDNHEPTITSVVFPSHMEESPPRIKKKEGRLFLSGTSALVGNASLANFFCVFVEEGDEGKEITCALIDRGSPGVFAGDEAQLPGLKVNQFAPITFEDVEVYPGCILGGRRSGKQIMEATEDLFYGLTGAIAIGAARCAYEKARSYANERYQFGKIIIHHQEIRRMLGNMLMKLQIGRAGYTQLFSEYGNSLSPSSASLVKAFCTDAALEISLDAIQIHGGYGYMHEYGVEKIMRDTKVLGLLGGSNPRLYIEESL